MKKVNFFFYFIIVFFTGMIIGDIFYHPVSIFLGLEEPTQLIPSVQLTKESSYLIRKNASISFTEPIELSNDFLITAINQNFCILPVATYTPASVPQEIEEKIKTNINDSIYKKDILTVGNVFFCNVEGKLFLCTAYHCIDDWEEKFKGLKSYTKKVCDDISLIDYKSMFKNGKALCFKNFQSNIYKTNFNFPNCDSVFIQGYFPDTKIGKVKLISIKGMGVKVYKNNFINISHLDVELLQDQIILVKLGKGPFDFPGFSGSPAFNSKGEVIGVVSVIYSNLSIGNDTTKAYYLGISTFHN